MPPHSSEAAPLVRGPAFEPTCPLDPRPCWDPLEVIADDDLAVPVCPGVTAVRRKLHFPDPDSDRGSSGLSRSIFLHASRQADPALGHCRAATATSLSLGVVDRSHPR